MYDNNFEEHSNKRRSELQELSSELNEVRTILRRIREAKPSEVKEVAKIIDSHLNRIDSALRTIEQKISLIEREIYRKEKRQ